MAWALDRPGGLRWHGRETTTDDGMRAVAVPPASHFAGILIVLTGAWGALSVFVGPLFNWNPTTNSAWSWTTQNWMLHLLPGVVGIVAGFLILAASPRRLTGGRGVIGLAALLAAAAGAWFVVGPPLWPTFRSGEVFQSADATHSFLYLLGSSIGPGLILAFLGGMALKAAIARTGMAIGPRSPEPGTAGGAIIPEELRVGPPAY